MVGASESSGRKITREVKSVVCDAKRSHDKIEQPLSSRCRNFERWEWAKKATSNGGSPSLSKISDTKLLVRSPPDGESNGKLWRSTDRAYHFEGEPVVWYRAWHGPRAPSVEFTEEAKHVGQRAIKHQIEWSPNA